MSVRLGILGFGIMGERLLRAALAHDPAVIRAVAVWDPSPAAATRLAALPGAPPMLADAGAVIGAADAIYIAAPPAAHIPLAEAALAAGRAIFLEKPLATDLPDARRFVASAAEARAAVNFPMASSPAVAELADWQAGIGAVTGLSIHAQFATWPRAWQRDAAGWLARRAEGGFTREVLSHFLFLTQRRLGPLTLHEARVTWPEGDGSETDLIARLDAGGVPVVMTGRVGRTDLDETNTWRLAGTKGAIRLRDWSIAEIEGADGTWRTAPDALPNPAMRPLVLQRQLDKLAAMTRGAPTDLARLAEALEVQEVVEAILAA